MTIPDLTQAPNTPLNLRRADLEPAPPSMVDQDYKQPPITPIEPDFFARFENILGMLERMLTLWQGQKQGPQPVQRPVQQPMSQPAPTVGPDLAEKVLQGLSFYLDQIPDGTTIEAIRADLVTHRDALVGLLSQAMR